jgi:predicted nucleic acid-binding protein
VRLLLDSTFVIDHLRGVQEAEARFARLFADGDEPVVNEIVVCEVRTGLRDADLPQLTALLRPTEFVQPGPVSAILAGQWRAEARARGHHLSLADSLIAAAAEAADAAVLTRNVRDFAQTPIRVETY